MCPSCSSPCPRAPLYTRALNHIAEELNIPAHDAQVEGAEEASGKGKETAGAESQQQASVWDGFFEQA